MAKFNFTLIEDNKNFEGYVNVAKCNDDAIAIPIREPLFTYTVPGQLDVLLAVTSDRLAGGTCIGVTVEMRSDPSLPAQFSLPCENRAMAMTLGQSSKTFRAVRVVAIPNKREYIERWKDQFKDLTLERQQDVYLRLFGSEADKDVRCMIGDLSDALHELPDNVASSRRGVLLREMLLDSLPCIPVVREVKHYEIAPHFL